MSPRRKERRVVAVAGAAALLAVGLNLAFSAVAAHRRRKRQELPGFSAQVNLSAVEIKRLADRIIAKSKETYDAVASVPLDKVNFANAIAPLAELDAQQFPLVQACVLPRMVSPSEDICRASAEAEKRLDSHFLLCRQREDVYRVVKAFTERGERIGPEATRFVQCLVREFECNGAKLTQTKRKELEKLKSLIDDLNLKYFQNMNDFTKFLLLSEEELAGMPLEFLKELEETDGKRKVLLTSYHVTPILEHCKVGSTRKLIAVAYGQKGGKQNVVILEKLVQIRHRLARLLGYSNYSDFAIEPRMPMTSRKVLEFLEELSEQLSDLANRELTVLKDLKMKEEGDAQFGMEDLLYYMKRAEQHKVDLDIGEIKRYFPVKLVISGMLKMFQDLFALRFEEIKDVEVWHDTVRLFSVWDASSSDLLGYFFLDIFSREGKYDHTCVVALQNGCMCSNGSRKVPVAVLLSQCPKEFDGNSALLRFPEVVRIFHEFSHVVHHISNRATFSRFSSLCLEGDFAEFPSLLLENWCYESISLKMMSGFYQDITKSVTTEACQSLKRRRDMFAGWMQQRDAATELIKHHLVRAQQRMIHQAVKHRSERTFKVGDWVYLKMQPYTQLSLGRHANHKLSFKYFGPYLILVHIGDVAYRLQLPAVSQIHPVIHVSMLKQALPPGQTSTTDIPLHLMTDECFHVTPFRVLDSRLVKVGHAAAQQLKIAWSGLPLELASWEDANTLHRKFRHAPAWGHAGSKGEGHATISTTTM